MMYEADLRQKAPVTIVLYASRRRCHFIPFQALRCVDLVSWPSQ